MVSPLSPAPGARPSRRDDERHNILERNANNHPIHNQILQDMPSQQRTSTKIWPPVIQNSNKHPVEALCVDLLGHFILKGKDGSAVDFMALTMIDPASSWFKIVELPLVIRLTTTMVNGKEKVSNKLIFNKSSNQIAR